VIKKRAVASKDRSLVIGNRSPGIKKTRDRI
jgi:hypothetical protein